MSRIASLGFRLLKAAGTHFSPGGHRGRLSVLMYHRVLPEHDPMTPEVTDAATFDRHIHAVSKYFNVLPLDEAIDQVYCNKLKPMSLAITFDDGHSDNLEIATPILKRYGVHATFFLCSGFTNGSLMYNDVATESLRRAPSGRLDLEWLGLKDTYISDVASRRVLIREVVNAIKYLDSTERSAACSRLERISGERLPTDLMMNFDQIKELFRKGMGIGAHTLSHPILTRVTNEVALSQILQNRDDLASITGLVPKLFAYPNGKPKVDFNDQHIEIVRNAGFDAAVTTSFGAVSPEVDRFQIPRLCPWDHNANILVSRILRMTRGSIGMRSTSANY